MHTTVYAAPIMQVKIKKQIPMTITAILIFSTICTASVFSTSDNVKWSCFWFLFCFVFLHYFWVSPLLLTLSWLRHHLHAWWWILSSILSFKIFLVSSCRYRSHRLAKIAMLLKWLCLWNNRKSWTETLPEGFLIQGCNETMCYRRSNLYFCLMNYLCYIFRASRCSTVDAKSDTGA